MGMVSYDHFKLELLLKLRESHSGRAKELVVNSTELVGSVRKGVLNNGTCCQMMKDEMKPGDILLQDEDSGVGITVRYLLPRTAFAAISDLATGAC